MNDGGLAKLNELIESVRVALLTTVNLAILRATPERAEYRETPGRIWYLRAALAATVTGRPAAGRAGPQAA